MRPSRIEADAGYEDSRTWGSRIRELDDYDTCGKRFLNENAQERAQYEIATPKSNYLTNKNPIRVLRFFMGEYDKQHLFG